MPSSKNTQANFSQPFGRFTSRKIDHDEEYIDYLPGYRYRIWHNDQSSNFPDHKHAALEIILCSQDTYTVTVGEEVYKLHEGDILFIPPMKVHSITAPESGERFIMLFDTTFFDYFKSKKQIDENTYASPEPAVDIDGKVDAEDAERDGHGAYGNVKSKGAENADNGCCEADKNYSLYFFRHFIKTPVLYWFTITHAWFTIKPM